MMMNASEALIGRARTAFLYEAQHRLARRACEACDLFAFVMLDERRPGHASHWAPHLRMIEMSSSMAAVHPMLTSGQRFVESDATLHAFVTANRRLARKCYEVRVLRLFIFGLFIIV